MVSPSAATALGNLRSGNCHIITIRGVHVNTTAPHDSLSGGNSNGNASNQRDAIGNIIQQKRVIPVTKLVFRGTPRTSSKHLPAGPNSRSTCRADIRSRARRRQLRAVSILRQGPPAVDYDYVSPQPRSCSHGNTADLGALCRAQRRVDSIYVGVDRECDC